MDEVDGFLALRSAFSGLSPNAEDVSAGGRPSCWVPVLFF